MARPIKKGLDYYPLNVDFLQDIKVRKIMRACGIQSITILISLLSSIYRDEGYYVVWDNDMSFLVADEVGASEGAVIEIVKKAVQVDFFDEHIFEEYKVLTSKGIQKRFIEAISRRKNIDLIKEYLLIDIINDYSNLDNVNIKSINDNRSTQSKVKESKEEKSKGIKSQKDCDDSNKDKTKYKFDEKSTEIELSRFMIKEILKVKDDSKVPNSDVKSLQNWSQDIDYMLRLDNRSARDIAELFRWAQQDTFWCSNIRSPRKLREKWDSLTLQKYEREEKKHGKSNDKLKRNTGVSSQFEEDIAERAGVTSL